MVAAFLVFAIGIGILMQVLATSMHSTRQSSDYTMAALWAQSKLDVVGVGAPIEPGSTNGRFDDTYAGSSTSSRSIRQCRAAAAAIFDGPDIPRRIRAIRA